MNSEEKQDGMLMKCNGTVGLHPSRILGFLGMDRARGSMGLSELALNGRSLAHHALLAEEEEEDGLVERSALSQGLVPLEELMVHQDTERNSTEEEVEQHSLLPYRLPNPFHLPGNIKQEINLSDAVMQMKKEGRPAKQLSDFQKRKRKQRPPAKILTVNEDGSLGLQSPRSHVCEHCSAAFRTNYHLQRHAFIHTGEKPFQCSQCDMRFIQKYLLQRHEKIHTGEKPFRCDECGMRFIQKYHMERHKRTHSGEKPYQCSHCQQFFSRTDRVLKHKRMCHENRNRNPDKATAKDGTVVSENGLVFSCPPKDSSPMKKKRQKAGEKPRHLANPPENTGVSEGKEDQRLSRNECLSLYSLASKVKHEYPVDEYSVELPDSRVCGSGPPGMNLTGEVHPPKLFLKKVSKRSQRQLTDQQDDLSPLSSFDDGKVSRYTFEHVGKPDMDAVGPVQGAPSKPAASSTNYDDAMQFLKKRRYLQAAVSTSGRDYALNMGMITTPNAVPQATGASIRNDAIPASILNAQTLKTEVKSSHEKNILPDEVLQTLLDHYSNKTNGQPELSFSVANTEVTSRMPINSSDMSAVTQGVTQGISSQVHPIEKASMLQEYSKFLQQALERTSQNDTYLNTQGLTFVTESQPLLNQPLFTTVDKLSTPSNRLQSGMSSPLRSSSEKSHFGLLVGDSQHSFSFSGDDTNPSSISPTEGFLEQVTAQKKTDNQVINPPFQIGTFEQNFQSQFQSSRSGTSSQFSFVSGAVTLQGHEDAKDFTEFPIANVTDTRTQMTSSPDSTASQTFS